MIQLVKWTCVFCLTGILSINAQAFQGEATYKSKKKLDFKMDSTQLGSEMHSKLEEMLKKQFEKTHVLNFNKEASVYKQDVSLGKPSMPASGMVINVIGTGGSDVLYKNTKEKRFAKKSEVMGKLFLVQDELNLPKWELTRETKNIGRYTCYKATQTIEVDKEVLAKYSLPEKKEKTIITAWYTPEIAVSHGPSHYWGLPGLILEVNDGDTTMVCSKIVLNPKDQKDIVEPTKGKKVSQEAYNKIMLKKVEEIKSRYNSGSENGSSFSFEIRN